MDHFAFSLHLCNSLWSFLLCLFGVSWVVPKQAVEAHFLGEHSILDLKRFFLCSLYDWMMGNVMSVMSDLSFSSPVEVLDLCSFC